MRLSELGEDRFLDPGIKLNLRDGAERVLHDGGWDHFLSDESP